MQLLSRRRSGPLGVRESSARMLLENCKGGQQRLEDGDDWPRLLAAYPALTGESESGSCGCNYSCPPSEVRVSAIQDELGILFSSLTASASSYPNKYGGGCPGVCSSVWWLGLGSGKWEPEAGPKGPCSHRISPRFQMLFECTNPRVTLAEVSREELHSLRFLTCFPKVSSRNLWTL